MLFIIASIAIEYEDVSLSSIISLPLLLISFSSLLLPSCILIRAVFSSSYITPSLMALVVTVFDAILL